MHLDGKLSCLQPNGIFEGNTELHCYEYRVADRYTSGRPDDILDFTWQLLHLVVFCVCLVFETEDHEMFNRRVRRAQRLSFPSITELLRILDC